MFIVSSPIFFSFQSPTPFFFFSLSMLLLLIIFVFPHFHPCKKGQRRNLFGLNEPTNWTNYVVEMGSERERVCGRERRTERGGKRRSNVNTTAIMVTTRKSSKPYSFDNISKQKIIFSSALY